MAKLERRIVTQSDLEVWTESETHNNVLSFVESLQKAAMGRANLAPISPSPVIHQLLHILEEISSLVDSHRVIKDKNVSRFGKVEFRDFYDALKSLAPLYLDLVPFEEEKLEAAEYLAESWGNRERIDYGSGHELNFICFLMCLKQLDILKPTDYEATVIKVFTKYIEVMRKIQKEYWLEPAGSHGVWGLDDYHFLPFLFGAAQLATHPHMKPKLIHNRELVEMYWPDYMYFECIHFINQIKTVPGDQLQVQLRWHSPMLDDISAAKLWQKITDGMIKMYRVEVLGKLPIVQHVMFGTLIPAPAGLSDKNEVSESDCGHNHDIVNTWGDCCGIKVPSAFAALQMNEKPVPFD